MPEHSLFAEGGNLPYEIEVGSGRLKDQHGIRKGMNKHNLARSEPIRQPLFPKMNRMAARPVAGATDMLSAGGAPWTVNISHSR